ncbi:GGDEF domain-containing protein [Vibrio hippocampi]|uniref:GGDEF domain-containing protein n=1 Tax=Vibrio hippocampi TaxID=654686 RepID=UPI001F165A81|nr:sensor domain-containing diguanylate cyclase [Vibrio hippocampi]
MLSKQQYLDILEQMPAHVFIFSEQGVYLDIFGGVDNNIDSDFKQYIGKNINDIFPQDLAQLFLGYISQTLDANATQVVKYHFSPEHLKVLPTFIFGQVELWIEGIIKPYVMEDGQRVVIWTARNVTEKHSLEEKLRQLSETDVLTQVFNRRAFMDRLFSCIERFEHTEQNTSFLMMDIDYFKRINDSLGHQLGDVVIKHVTEVITRELRESDIIGRIGGEEFGIILPNTNISDAEDIAERLRYQIQNTPCFVDDRNISVTVSIGVSKLASGEDECKYVLTRSDRAMYYSKNSGRNCVTVYCEALCQELFS